MSIMDARVERVSLVDAIDSFSLTISEDNLIKASVDEKLINMPQIRVQWEADLTGREEEVE